MLVLTRRIGEEIYISHNVVEAAEWIMGAQTKATQ